METQFKHLTMTHCTELIKLLLIYEELLDGTLDTWKTHPADFNLKKMQSQYDCDHTHYQS